MNEPRRCDVLVIGLGPAGSAAAAAAAAAGLDVLAIERKARIGEPVQCAEFVPQPLARHATAAGVLQQRIAAMNTRLPSGSQRRSEFPGLMIDRAAFDRALAERAAAAGATLRVGTRLRDLRVAERQALLANDDELQTVAYRWLVAADGPHSRVARCLGLPPLETIRTRQYTVPLLRAEDATDIWLGSQYPGGYAWLFPRGDEANLGLGIDQRFAADLKAPLDALHLQLQADGRVGPEIRRRTGGAIPVGGLRPRLVVENTIFVGDAAGLTHPLTGAGIAAAVSSGERAGAACAAARDGSGELGDYEEDMRDQFAASLERGLRARRRLEGVWNTAACNDEALRGGWIAFDEYFAA